MKKRINNLIIRDIVLLLILVFYYFINKHTGIFIPCIFRELTGFKCPGCGITHALFALINLNFKEAFFHNPLVFIYSPFICLYLIYQDYLYVYEKKDKFLKKIPNWFFASLIIITILYGVLRNIYQI